MKIQKLLEIIDVHELYGCFHGLRLHCYAVHSELNYAVHLGCYCVVHGAYYYVVHYYLVCCFVDWLAVLFGQNFVSEQGFGSG